MAVIIDREKCNGCGVCMELCPGDLFILDSKRKAEIRSNPDCWNCMVCIKHCPVRAISLKLPYQIALYGAKLEPEMRADKIIWTLTDVDGKEKKFELRRKTS